MRFKKLITAVISACILTSACVIAASAAEPPSTSTLHIAGTNYDGNVNQTGTGWKWMANDKTLQLNNYNGGHIKYTTSADSAVVKVNVSGTNTVTNEQTGDTTDAMQFEANAEISGNGILNIDNSSKKDCISAWKNSDDDKDSYLKITGTTVNMTNSHYGMYSANVIMTNAIVNINNIATGIYTSSLDMKDSTLNGTYNGDTILFSDFSDYTYVQLVHLDEFDNVSYASKQVFNATNSTISVDANIAGIDDLYVYGITTEGNYKTNLKGCTYNFSVGNSGGENEIIAYAISSNDAIDIVFDDCKLTGTNTEGIDSETIIYLYNAENLTIKGNSVVTLNNVAGVCFTNTFVIENSEIKGKTSEMAIYASTSMDVTNSMIDIETTSTESVVLCSYAGTLTITNSNVHAKGKGYAFSNFSSFTINDSDVRFENVDGTEFDLDNNRCNLSYTNPDEWGVYIDGALSQDYTVASENIVFGNKIFAITHDSHEYANWVSDDDNTHSSVCICQNKKTEPHTWDNGKITKEAKIGEKGQKTYTCTKCGKTKVEDVPALVDDKKDNPDTGMNNVATSALALMLISGTAIVALKKKNKK